MGRVFWKLGAAILLAVTILAGPGSALAEDLVKGGYTFPVAVLDFRRSSVHDFEPQHPGLGFAVGYQSETLRVTVYVYDGGATGIGEGSKTPAVARELDQAYADMRKAVEQGAYQAGARYEAAGEGDVAWPDVPVAYRYRALDLIAGSSRRRSYLFLTGLRGKFLKLRITAAQDIADVDRETRAFLKALTVQLTRKAGSPPRRRAA